MKQTAKKPKPDDLAHDEARYRLLPAKKPKPPKPEGYWVVEWCLKSYDPRFDLTQWVCTGGYDDKAEAIERARMEQISGHPEARAVYLTRQAKGAKK